MKVQPGKQFDPWASQIVMSTLPATSLPRSLADAGAKRICRVESQLPPDMKLKNKHWLGTRPKYYRAKFEMQVLVGAADLKFRILSKEGVISKDHNSIGVEWIESKQRAGPAELA
jgi:hypothetical protein